MGYSSMYNAKAARELRWVPIDPISNAFPLLEKNKSLEKKKIRDSRETQIRRECCPEIETPKQAVS